MGNLVNQSKQAKGTLQIELDQQLVMCGSIITGRISCILDQEFPSSIITLELDGSERIMCYGEQSVLLQNQIVNLKQVVHSFNKDEKVPDGRVNYQFQMQLPSNLPSSFYFLGKSNSEIQYTYVLKAKMEACATQNGQQPLYEPLIASTVVVISNPPAQVTFNMPVVREFKVENFLFNKGTSKIQINIGKDFYEPNEVVQVSTLIDNLTCNSAITEFEITLNRLITCQSENGTKFIDKAQLMYRKSEGVKAKEKDLKNTFLPLGQIVTYPKEIYPDNTVQIFKSRNPNLSNDLNYWLSALQPSVKTSHLECKYYLELKLKHGALLGNDLPSTIIHMNIYYNTNNPCFSQALQNQQQQHLYYNAPVEQQIPNYSGVLSFMEAQQLYYECNQRAFEARQQPQVPQGMPVNLSQYNNPVVVQHLKQEDIGQQQQQNTGGYPIQYAYYDQAEEQDLQNPYVVNPQDMIGGSETKQQ